MDDLYHLTSDYQWWLEHERTVRNLDNPPQWLLDAAETELHRARQALHNAWREHHQTRR